MGTSFSKRYKTKLISGKEAAGLVKSGDCIHLGGAANIASIIDKYIAERVNELEAVKLIIK